MWLTTMTIAAGFGSLFALAGLSTLLQWNVGGRHARRIMVALGVGSALIALVLGAGMSGAAAPAAMCAGAVFGALALFFAAGIDDRRVTALDAAREAARSAPAVETSTQLPLPGGATYETSPQPEIGRLAATMAVQRFRPSHGLLPAAEAPSVERPCV